MDKIVKHSRHRRLLVTSLLMLVFAATVTAAFALRRPPPEYTPGLKSADITDSLGRNLPAHYPGIRFDDVTAAAGITFRHFHGTRSSQLPEDMGSGAAWGDYDNDGYPDLFLANESGPLTLAAHEVQKSPARCELYHNLGNGRFENVTDAAGLGNLRGLYMGAAWGDYDNDGRRDLVVTAYGHIKLFNNIGEGRFRDVSVPSGMSRFSGFWAGASWSDYDRDGRLDLYVCGYVKYRKPAAREKGALSKQFDSQVPFTLNPSSYPPERNLLFHNEGGGRFTEVAQHAGVDDLEGRSLAAAWCDFDHDGWADLYVNNDVSMHAFYRNLGNGRFQDISTSSWACDYRGGMGIAIGDWDNNGDMDMFLTHWLAQENALYQNLFSTLPPSAAQNRKAHKGQSKPVAAHNQTSKRKQLTFIDISDQVGLGQSTLDFVGWGTSFIDIDNDGKLDLVMANGSTLNQPTDTTKLVPMRNQLFWNGANGRKEFEVDTHDAGFFEVEDAAGEALKQPNVGRGLAVADFDCDGNADILITRNGATPLLLHNQGATKSAPQHNWLAIKLTGTRSNRDAMGARITLYAGGTRQVRVVGAAPSYLSQDDLTQHFGLGPHQQVDRLEVLWPSGLRQQFRALTTGHLWRLQEGGQPQRWTPRRNAAQESAARRSTAQGAKS